MPYKIHISLLLFIIMGCSSKKNTIPDYLIGEFQDDYKIEYQLSDDIFIQKPSTRYHIIKWDIENQYFVARNDSLNAYDGNLYSRIDWVKFENMPPFDWGFCLSAYNASSLDSAEAIQIADKSNPKTGCNGYPFSRMKPITK